MKNRIITIGREFGCGGAAGGVAGTPRGKPGAGLFHIFVDKSTKSV